MTEQQIEEYAQELLWKYQTDALPYFERAKDIVEEKEFELDPTEDSFCRNLIIFKKSFLADMDCAPLIESANTYLAFCKKYRITPEEDVSERIAETVLENVYVNIFLQFIEQWEKNYPENENIKKIINETKETFRQYFEKRKQEKEKREAAEKAKKEEEKRRVADEVATRFLAITLNASNEEEIHKEAEEKAQKEVKRSQAEERQAAEEKAKKDEKRKEQARLRKEKKEQEEIEKKKKKQFRAKIYFHACIAIAGIVLLYYSYEWYHYVLTIAGIGVIYYLWFFQNLDKLYNKALEAIDLYDIML